MSQLKDHATGYAYVSPVRRARETDLKQLAGLERLIFPPGIADSRETLRKRLKAFRDGFLAYEEEGQILGYLSAEFWDEMHPLEAGQPIRGRHVSSGQIMYIHVVAVHPDHQAKGIGTKLMHALLDLARRHHCSKALLVSRRTQKRAHGFYSKFRFKLKKTVPGFFKPLHREPVDGLVFELDLRLGSQIKDKIPKQLDARKLLGRLTTFMYHLRREDRIALVHHLDADGLTSACILNRAIEKLRGRPAELEIPSGYSDRETREKIIPLLVKHDINKVIVSDIGIDSNPVLIEEAPKNIQFVVFDHHKIYQDLASGRVIFIKAQYLSALDGSKYPAAKLVFDCMNQVIDVRETDWISAIGVLADMGLRTWRKFIKDTCHRNKVPLEKLLELKELISSVESLAPKEFPRLFREFYCARNWREVLRSQFMRYKKTFEREIGRLYSGVRQKAEFIPELDLIFYEIKSGYEIKSALVNKLSTQLFPRQTLILIQDKGDKLLRFSGRRQDFKVKVNDLLEEAVQGLELGSAGGHIPAAAGRVARTERDSFKSNIVRVLVRQYFASFRIRKAKSGDLDRIVEIQRKAFNRGICDPRSHYAARLELHPAGCFAAEVNNQVIGYCLTERWTKRHGYCVTDNPRQTHVPDGPILFIPSTATLPEFRGKGIATALLREAIGFARKQGIKKVTLGFEGNNPEGIAICKNMGFRLYRNLRKSMVFYFGKKTKKVDCLVFDLKLRK